MACCTKEVRPMIKQILEIALADEQNDIGPTLSTFGQQCCRHNDNIMPTLAQQMTFIWVDTLKKIVSSKRNQFTFPNIILMNYSFKSSLI